MIEQGIYAYLIATAGVNNIVQGRVYPVMAPLDDIQNNLAHVTYMRTSTFREYHLKAQADKPTATFQVLCWGAGKGQAAYSASKALAHQVRLALSGFIGTWPGGHAIHRVLVSDEKDIFVFEPGEADARGVELTVTVQFTETVITY